MIAADGILRAPPQNDTGHTWMLSDAELFDLVKYGTADFLPPGLVSPMPVFAGQLTDVQIEDTLAFVKSSLEHRRPRLSGAAQPRACRHAQGGVGRGVAAAARLPVRAVALAASTGAGEEGKGMRFRRAPVAPFIRFAP